MKILVASSTGKTGSLTAKALHDAGHEVLLGTRDPDAAEAPFPGAKFVRFDYSDPTTMTEALSGVDAVFSAAPFHTLPSSEQALIKAAQTTGVRAVVKLSAMGTEQDPSSPHRQAEVAFEESGLNWTILRPTFFMQNYVTIALGSINGAGSIFEPADDGASAFVDARDIAAVAAAALTDPEAHHGKAYNLTGPEVLTRSQVAEKISAAAGRTITYVNVDDAALRSAMAGAPPALIELMSGLYGYVRAGYTAVTADGVQQALGRPPAAFDTFARDHAEIWQTGG